MKNQPIRRVLVANRGEIAVRVIRGCHELGIEAVAVFSEADSNAPHVRLANDSVCVGPPASSQSYLVADRILQVALDTGCDAVHPGYGFLSENASFAKAVQEAGLVWIGPPSAAIVSMGNKTAARRKMSSANVPVVPGTLEPVHDVKEAVSIAVEIGFPVMLKAASGGGGKGMRRVEAKEGLGQALEMAISEATKSFGDSSVYIEKCIDRPRHVEIQVLADQYGNVVHLFERDCSIQRRHQKVIEETPCPALPESTRQAMCKAACDATRAVDYVGVGTVEFLLAEDGGFYFLEMNTRLQVEHPITEMVTGVDLVQAQLRVAQGEPLWFKQSDLEQRGCAIECRIYAEDAVAGFRPSPGPLFGYREPAGAWVRVDSGVLPGMEIPIHYDPMIAKLVVWGSNRKEAISRCRRALEDYQIVGTTTSIPFFLACFRDEGFLSGDYNTSFISPQWLAENLPEPEVTDDLLMAAAIVRFEAERALSATKEVGEEAGSAWKQAHQWKTYRGAWR